MADSRKVISAKRRSRQESRDTTVKTDYLQGANNRPGHACPYVSRLARRESVRHRFDMTDSAKGHAPILAAGGIVLRGNSKPRVAIVRLRREKAWVLPKGKLLPREHPRVAAKREVLEETGQDVSVHGFLGSMSYTADGRVKIVQFWLMRAVGAPVRELMDDVKAVKWLPLKQAVDTLTRAHEKVFLANVGPIALEAAKKSVRDKPKPLVRNRGRRRGRSAPVAPVEHLLTNDYEKTRQNVFVKALGSWIGRVTQSAARRVG
jgi:8-oxo-dGTP pyrophosphatase MutT (NUDIX family)